MTDRFDKFTERARKTLQLAQEEAQRFNHNYIGTEHILLGLVREGDGVAARVLNNLGIELNKVRSAVEFIIGRGDRMVMGEIGLTPRAKRVIELAVDEARRLNHHYIGTEHLLLGLVREGEGIAAGVLESLGVSLKDVRAQVIEVLQTSSGYSMMGSAGVIGSPPAALRGWVPSSLELSLLAHVDNTFLEVMRDAMTITFFLNRKHYDTDVLLAALTHNEAGATSRLLRKHGVEPADIYDRIESDPSRLSSEPFNLDAVRVVRLAIDAARSIGVKATADYLLLGLMFHADNPAYVVLTEAGITVEEVRALLGGDLPPEPGQPVEV
jgi:ATP-dependent Clp protease ATP-binding subunit ClpA